MGHIQHLNLKWIWMDGMDSVCMLFVCFCLFVNVTNNHIGVCDSFVTSDSWPSDAIWWHRSRLSLAQVMACCLTAPSHYLDQCWLIINEAHWHLAEGNFTEIVPDISVTTKCLIVAYLKMLLYLPEVSELMHCCLRTMAIFCRQHF